MTSSHTEREAAILESVRSALETFNARYKEGAFCTGYGWATLNGILVLLGEQPQTAPWKNEARTDDPETSGKQA